MSDLDERALQRLGITLVMEGAEYEVGYASGGLVVFVRSIDQPSAALMVPAYTAYTPINQPSAAPVRRECKPATGQTIRLPHRCAECDDELPEDAIYCINCSALVR